MVVSVFKLPLSCSRLALSLLFLVLTACGGGGSSGATGGAAAPVITIGSLTYEPKGAYVGGPANVTINGTLAVSPPATASTLQARLVAPSGQVAGQVSVPIQQAPNSTGSLVFSITVAVSQLTQGAYALQVSVATPAGAQSNVITESFSVLPNPWSALAAMPTPRTGFTLAESSGRIYVIAGGASQTAASSVMEVYDPSSKTWSTATQPAIARSGASAVAVGGRIFLIGGANNGSPNGVPEVEVFDPVTSLWSLAGKLTTPRRDAAVAVVNSKIYVIGGLTGSTYLPTVEELDVATNTWVASTSLPEGRSMSAATAANGGVYLSGGRTGTGSLDAALLAFDPGSGTWNTFNGFNRTIYTRASHALVAVAGSVLSIGGETTVGSTPVTDTVEAAATGANLNASLQWRLRAPIPEADGYVRAAAIGGKIYVITPSRTWLYDPALDVL